LNPDTLSTGAILLPVGLALFSVAGLVLSDYRDYRPGRYLFKPLAALAFVWLAISAGATESSYGQWLLGGLLLCLLGDLLLMPDSPAGFLAGLLAFLCGHLLYGIAFLQLPHNTTALALSGVPALLLAAAALRWLWPHVEKPMKLPVALYTAVITAMLLCASVTWGQAGALLIIAGAWGFAISDLAVARRQFIDPGPANALWGTPLYFLSQMLLASTVFFH
jgi:uncharacterized membrane protein YhhN